MPKKAPTVQSASSSYIISFTHPPPSEAQVQLGSEGNCPRALNQAVHRIPSLGETPQRTKPSALSEIELSSDGLSLGGLELDSSGSSAAKRVTAAMASAQKAALLTKDAGGQGCANDRSCKEHAARVHQHCRESQQCSRKDERASDPPALQPSEFVNMIGHDSSFPNPSKFDFQLLSPSPFLVPLGVPSWRNRAFATAAKLPRWQSPIWAHEGPTR
ncbi:hypothetical protein BGZ63DRAFT_407692 [Mariannaea sp. PMI_226]|nr:hypothetical protein BGZ63DRAFT_407692 [Mariannaea sp. PMI_226]